MNFRHTMEWVVNGFEVAGVAILVVGSLLAFVSAVAVYRRDGRRAGHERARQDVAAAFPRLAALLGRIDYWHSLDPGSWPRHGRS